MQHQRRARVGEEAAVAGVEVALRRQPLGEQDGVLVQLDVVVIDRGPAAFLADGGAVHQLPGADQLAVHEDRVIRRDQQIAVRHVVGEGVAFDADRRHGLRSRMRGQIDAAMAEPLDGLRLQFAVDQGEDLSCLRRRLSIGPFAGGGQDASCRARSRQC